MRPEPAPHPPEALVRSIVEGPSLVSGFEWAQEAESTMAMAAEAATRGAPEVFLAGADVQTAGRGRHGRRWLAPPGTSLQVSWLLRPQVVDAALGLIPLLAGLVVREAVAAHLPGANVALKWPNDVLVDDRKAAGVLVQRLPDAVVVGTGVNTDWRGVQRSAELDGLVCMSEAAGRPVDRWRLLAGLAGLWSRRYPAWCNDPYGVLEAYRAHCATLGREVRAALGVEGEVRGNAVGIAEDGGLEVATGGGVRVLRAGDVEHVRNV